MDYSNIHKVLNFAQSFHPCLRCNFLLTEVRTLTIG